MQIPILGILLLFFSAGLSPVDSNDLLHDLANHETTASAATQIIMASESQPELKQILSAKLPRMLAEAKDTQVLWSEASVAAKLKILSTIPVLIELLDQPNLVFEAHTMTRYAELHDDPVGRALYEIGEPTISSLARPLESKRRDTRVRAMRILLLMKTPESRAVLEQYLPKENDADLRRYLIANGVGSTQ
jgi:HEAT repeat protein